MTEIIAIRKFRTAAGQTVTLTFRAGEEYGSWSCSGCLRSAANSALTGYARPHAENCREFQ